MATKAMKSMKPTKAAAPPKAKKTKKAAAPPKAMKAMKAMKAAPRRLLVTRQWVEDIVSHARIIESLADLTFR